MSEVYKIRKHKVSNMKKRKDCRTSILKLEFQAFLYESTDQIYKTKFLILKNWIMISFPVLILTELSDQLLKTLLSLQNRAAHSSSSYVNDTSVFSINLMWLS